MGGEQQAEGFPDLIERYTTANQAYEYDGSDSEEDEELMEEGGRQDTTMTYEIHAPDPAPPCMAPESRSKEDPRELESGRHGKRPMILDPLVAMGLTTYPRWRRLPPAEKKDLIVS